MKRVIRVLPKDRGSILWLIGAVSLLALGGAFLAEAVSVDLVRAAAQNSARAWAFALVEGAAGLPKNVVTATDTANASPVSIQARDPGFVFRYKVWNASGKLVYDTNQPVALDSTETILQAVGGPVTKTVLAGTPYTRAGQSKKAGEPAYFSESLVPIIRQGAIVGIIDVYMNQTQEVALFRKSLLTTMSIIAVAVLLAGGLPGIMVYRKMQDQRVSQESALFAADHDSLTGLANRRRLGEWAKLALAWNGRTGASMATMLIDLDHFKDINDSYGHAAGDAMLKMFADRLSESVEAEDIVARLGGDEFVVLQVGVPQPAGAAALAQRILDAVSKPYDYNGIQLNYSASIGVAVSPDNAEGWDSLLSAADAAMYKAKAEGRGSVRFYEVGMDKAFRQRREVEDELRRATELRAFQLAYQPLYSFKNGELLGFEALLRWPEGWSPRSPVDFIPVAEESGLIIPIGAEVLEVACNTAAAWDEPLKVAVNLSRVQLEQADVVTVVQSALESSGLDPARLELEITEGLLLNHSASVLDQLSQLRAMGISIALDDFGTGYSSLSYLWRFKFDILKIDRSFISEMHLSRKASAIVKTIVLLGKILGLQVTAEGVETQEQADTLGQLGCDKAQGYLFSRPVSKAEADQLVMNKSLPEGTPDLILELRSGIDEVASVC
jgi:diguanylate cyclase (GGDEF)-like protein